MLAPFFAGGTFVGNFETRMAFALVEKNAE
jgi:hypothetical protein